MGAGDVSATDDIHWQQTNDDIRGYVKRLKAEGVKTITWEAAPQACDRCAVNIGKTVKTGQQFPSGAFLPPEHNRCVCNWVDDQGHVYQWTGTDGVYKQEKGASQ